MSNIAVKDGAGSDVFMAALGAGTNADPFVTKHQATVGGYTDTPSSATLTRPADSVAYAANDLIASSTTAGSVVVPNVAVARNAAGSGLIRGGVLRATQTSGLSACLMRIDLWSGAPTFVGGDNAAYAVATGAAAWLGAMNCTLQQFNDGAVASMLPEAGTEIGFKLASGQLIYWTLQTQSAFTPQSAVVFTFVPVVLQD